MNTGYRVRILLDSENPYTGTRLTTFECTYPRSILAEVNTHRVLSRSSESSRAIPVAERIKAVREDPYVPQTFGKNRPGMQFTEEVEDSQAAYAIWADAVHDALRHAERMAALGVHKEIANRLLEPFAYVSSVISGTDWSNFDALRTHQDASFAFRPLAEMMVEAREKSTPLLAVEHMPYLQKGEEHLSADVRAMICAARCARVSYKPFEDSKADVEKDLALAYRLRNSGHMSPFEHVAFAARGQYGNFRDWKQLRKSFPHEEDYGKFLRAKKGVLEPEDQLALFEGKESGR